MITFVCPKVLFFERIKKSKLQLMLTIYHNPRCGKSRDCLAFLDEKNIPYQTVLYLKENPNKLQLQELLQKLDIPAIDLIRKNEAVWKEKFSNQQFTEAQLIQILVEYPILIQRPIVVGIEKAVVARPVENCTSLLP